MLEIRGADHVRTGVGLKSGVPWVNLVVGCSETGIALEPVRPGTNTSQGARLMTRAAGTIFVPDGGSEALGYRVSLVWGLVKIWGHWSMSGA